MASGAPSVVGCLLVVCLLGALCPATNGEGVAEPIHGSKSRLYGNKVPLLKMAIRDIYARNQELLKQDLLRSLAVIDSAHNGDMGPVKRSAGTPGTTSLGGGALYFLARGLNQNEPTPAFEDNVQNNQRIFDIVGK